MTSPPQLLPGSLEITRRRLRAVLELARATWSARPSDRGPDLGPILEAAAALLDLERVSYWRVLAADGTVRGDDLFLAPERRHLHGADAGLPDLPLGPGLSTLPEPLVVHARAAEGPAAVGELLAYLERHRVFTILLAPVRLAGETVGLVGHEHVGAEPRAFGPDDRLVASAIAELVALCLEASARRQEEERAVLSSLHDPLTDLPNRRLFLERADRSLRGLERRTGLVAVLSIEVEGPPPSPASTGGREASDGHLAEAARALVGVLRPADTPARLGESRFGVLIDRLDEPWEAIAVAERVLAALTQPPRGAAIGVAMSDGSQPTTAPALLENAETALGRARAGGGSRYEVFETTMRRQVLERMSLGWALRDALHLGQFAIEYQPEIALSGRRLMGLEALLRWDRPGHGRLLPSAFLDLAEPSGLVVPIGAWVLREACRRTREWRRDPRATSLGLRVNLSARQFEEPALVETVAGILSDTGLPAQALCLEITETVLMSNAAASLGTLTALKALGVSLAIDDFGIGYSSLAYLKRFPVDTLKIDKSFVDGLGSDPIDLPIVQAIVSLGRTLGLQVVAEGVERPLQEQTLRALGCERVQGFLYSPAVPPEKVPSLFTPSQP